MKFIPQMTAIIRQGVTAVLLMLCASMTAQNAAEEIKAEPQCSGGLIYSLPTDTHPTDTPAPGGKKPFYISHYGCSAAYYLEDQKDYEIPLATMAKADSMNVLSRRADHQRRPANETIGAGDGGAFP